MFRRLALVGAVLTAMLVSLLAAPASAATLRFSYFAAAGGTKINAIGTTISSDLTAQSAISGTAVPHSNSNAVTALEVSGLATVGAVQTRTSSAAVGDGVALTSYARTAGVDLLNGLITADAVETTNVTTGTADSLSATAATEFVNLKVIGVNLPVNIPKNYVVQIPKVARIILNAAYTTTDADGNLSSIGYGAHITLLQPVASAPAGAVVVLNPTVAAMAPATENNVLLLGGYGYGSQVLFGAGVAGISGQVGKTAAIAPPPSGTGGNVRSNSTAAVNVPGVLQAGAVYSTTRGVTGTTTADVTNTNEIADLNLLNGLVTADAIEVSANTKVDGTKVTGAMTMKLVNLVVAGQPIPIDVGPNTKIEVPGVATIIINERLQTFNVNRIRAVYVKLLQPTAGLKAGAEIELGVAASWVTKPQ